MINKKLSLNTTVAVLFSLGLLAGCSTASKKSEPPPAPAPKPAAAPAPAPAPAPVMAPASQPKYVIEGVRFEFDSAALKPEAKTTLDAVATQLRSQPDVMYKISVYTDTSGPEAHNMQLSERRAQSVRDYLVDKGVAASQLTAMGFGESNPLVSNDTLEGRMKNRRVEIEPETAAAAISAAEKAMKMAKPACNLWRDTKKIMGKAKSAQEKGDKAKATKLANKARFQAEACVKQAQAEKAKF